MVDFVKLVFQFFNKNKNKMSNISNNRISVIATQAQLEDVKAGIQAIGNNLPFLVGLKTEERSSLMAIDVNNKAFTEDAINAGLVNQELLPAYVSVKDMQLDLGLFVQLDVVIPMVKQLLEKLMDTQLLAGSEAYMSALMLYRLFKSAAGAGIPGADAIVAQLEPRFAAQSARAPKPTSDTE